MQQTPRKIFIGDLLNCKIVTAEGKTIGHVADIQLSPAPEYQVVALIFGLHGWLYRLHFLNPFRRSRTEPPTPDLLPWEAVAAFERPIIKLKPGYDKKHL